MFCCTRILLFFDVRLKKKKKKKRKKERDYQKGDLIDDLRAVYQAERIDDVM